MFDARASFIDPHTLDVGGKRVTAKRIVIATGGHPERPPIPGAELGIISDDAFYLKRMPQRVAIVGSGYIAVEFAGIFRAPRRRDAPGLPPAAAAARLRSRHARRRWPRRWPRRASSLHPELPAGDGGSGRRRPRADLWRGRDADAGPGVLRHRPRAGHRAASGLDKAGVSVNANGAVIVDDHLRTTQPHIYAMGDVTDRLNLTPVATAEGHALADTLFGKTAARASRCTTCRPRCSPRRRSAPSG